MSITEIARLAGVSTSSVSNYFNRPERVGAVTAARIRAVVGRTGYVPDERRPGPKTGDRIGVRAGCVLLLAVGCGSLREFLAQSGAVPFLDGVREGLRARGLSLLIDFASSARFRPCAVFRTAALSRRKLNRSSATTGRPAASQPDSCTGRGIASSPCSIRTAVLRSWSNAPTASAALRRRSGWRSSNSPSPPFGSYRRGCAACAAGCWRNSFCAVPLCRPAHFSVPTTRSPASGWRWEGA